MTKKGPHLHYVISASLGLVHTYRPILSTKLGSSLYYSLQHIIVLEYYVLGRSHLRVSG